MEQGPGTESHTDPPVYQAKISLTLHHLQDSSFFILESHMLTLSQAPKAWTEAITRLFTFPVTMGPRAVDP